MAGSPVSHSPWCCFCTATTDIPALSWLSADGREERKSRCSLILMMPMFLKVLGTDYWTCFYSNSSKIDGSWVCKEALTFTQIWGEETVVLEERQWGISAVWDPSSRGFISRWWRELVHMAPQRGEASNSILSWHLSQLSFLMGKIWVKPGKVC